MQTVNPADRAVIAYDTAGEGEPVVLLHGSALSKAVWRGFGYVRELREHHRLVFVDLRGHGRSEKPTAPTGYAIDSFVEDVLAVLDAEGIAQAHVVGYSLGGRVALNLGIAAPERVRTLGLLGASARPQAGVFDQLFFPGAAAVIAESGMEGFIARWTQVAGVGPDPSTAAAFRNNDPAALAAYIEATEAEGGIPDALLAQLRIPTLVAVGELDDIRLEDAQLLTSVLPDSRLLLLPGRTHGSTLAARELILGALVPLWREHPIA